MEGSNSGIFIISRLVPLEIPFGFAECYQDRENIIAFERRGDERLLIGVPKYQTKTGCSD